VNASDGTIAIDNAVYLLDSLERKLIRGAELAVHAPPDTLPWGFSEVKKGEREAQERQQAAAYWTMLQWCWRYYRGMDTWWNCRYPYRVAPTLAALKSFDGTIGAEHVQVPGASLDEPLPVYAHLALLTPPTSAAAVLPAALLVDYETSLARKELNKHPDEVDIATVVAWCTERNNCVVQNMSAVGVDVFGWWEIAQDNSNRSAPSSLHPPSVALKKPSIFSSRPLRRGAPLLLAQVDSTKSGILERCQPQQQCAATDEAEPVPGSTSIESNLEAEHTVTAPSYSITVCRSSGGPSLPRHMGTLMPTSFDPHWSIRSCHETSAAIRFETFSGIKFSCGTVVSRKQTNEGTRKRSREWVN
jgi:hypothetical protein